MLLRASVVVDGNPSRILLYLLVTSVE